MGFILLLLTTDADMPRGLHARLWHAFLLGI